MDQRDEPWDAVGWVRRDGRVYGEYEWNAKVEDEV
jgi:hypothetical protein